MKKTMTVVISTFLVLLSSCAFATDDEGSWSARLKESGRIYIQMQDERDSTFGSTYDRNAFRGLAQTPKGPAEFEFQSEPGTFYFKGTFSGNHGGGVYTFQPNPQFLTAMKNLGYNVSPAKLKLLARVGFRTEQIKEYMALGYSHLTLEELIEMVIHDVTPEYIKALGARGYKSLRRERLVEMSIHDITPEYIDALGRAGFTNLSAEQLVELSIADLTPEKISEFQQLGFDKLSANELTEMSLHDVDAEFIRGLKNAGYPHLTSRRLVEFRIHDVTPEFINELASEGFEAVKADDLVAMKIHDVDASFIRKAKKTHPNITVDDLIELRIHED